MSINFNINGDFKELATCKVKISDVWKIVDSIYVNVDGTWQEVYSDIPPTPLYQPWTNYPDSPELTSSVPYQYIYTTNSSPRLALANDKIYYLAGQVRTVGVMNVYFISGGIWTLSQYQVSYTNDTSSLVSREANNDIYDSSGLSGVYFAKTTL